MGTLVRIGLLFIFAQVLFSPVFFYGFYRKRDQAWYLKPFIVWLFLGWAGMACLIGAGLWRRLII